MAPRGIATIGVYLGTASRPEAAPTGWKLAALSRLSVTRWGNNDSQPSGQIHQPSVLDKGPDLQCGSAA